MQFYFKISFPTRELFKSVISMILFSFFILGFQNNIVAQDLLKNRDLKTFKTELLTDADILKIKQQLSSQNVTIDQVRPLLINRGMSLTEFSKLKTRLQSGSSSRNSTTAKYKYNEKEADARKLRDQKSILEKGASINGLLEKDSLDLLYAERAMKPLIDPRIFGSELFNKTESSDPEFGWDVYNMATPVNYELGPGDLVQLVIFGQQEYTDELEVNREGAINVESVGLVNIGGLTIEAALVKLKSAMARAYPTLSAGSSKLSLSLSEIRTIHVTVVGANRSGTIDIPSLYSVYGVLSKAGGPTNMGSFRNIELVRNNKVVKKIDLYKLLAKGDQTDNVRLKDNDVIRIPSYQNRVELSGQIKRPGLYEVQDNESFADILAFAGGFDDTAYTASVKVIRKNDREREVKDLSSIGFNQFKPSTGDQFVVARILERYNNRIKVTGAVFRPDMYEYSPGMKVSDLIAKADGTTEDAFLERALLVRQKEDMTREMKSINLFKALQKDPAHNLELKKEDELLVSSILDLKDSLRVTLQGEVHVPGEYHFIDGMTLKGLILQAGGFTDASSANIEVAHLIARDVVAENDLRSSTIENIKLTDTLTLSELDILLKPYDVVTVRKKPAYNKVETVLVIGQVQFPGPYALNTANERVSDLYKRVGGLLSTANLSGAYLKRFKSEDERKRVAEDARRLQSLFSDSASRIIKDVEKEYDKIPLDMQMILKNPGSTEDVVLKSRDELIIPKIDDQVRVSGSVLQSTQIPYHPGKNFKSYISSAGGFSRDAWKRSAYIVYANGRAATTKKFLIFKHYPRVHPGAEIIVPQEPPAKAKISATEFIGISSAIASLAAVVITLLRL
ncbi:MAG: SLBB domain-containing protein [Chitinophagaceae bacterium]